MRIEQLAKETAIKVKHPVVSDKQAMVMACSLVAVAIDNLRDSMEVALSDIVESQRNQTDERA